PRMQSSLNLFQSILRFLIAGLSLLLFVVPWAGTPYLLPYSLGVLLLASLVTFFLEWLIETAVSHHPETWAMRLSSYVRVLYLVMSPLLALPFLFISSSETNQEGGVTETELISLVEARQEEGLLEQEEQKMIVSIFRLGDTLVREIMVPRIDILALDINTPIDQTMDALQQSGHSRVPVFKDSVDNILGLLYAKDLLGIWREGKREISLSDQLRQVYFVPESKKAGELLAELQAKRIHMAIVVDEYGGVAGLVTLEDIVEEIVGEIRDEYDQAEELVYQEINDDEYLFQGRIDLDDFNDIMGTQLPNSEADTLSGLIYSRIGRVPTAGDNVQIEGLQLTVEQVSGQRIRKVRAQRLTSISENGDKDRHAD
ncbi:MAG: HlyC/CorC family transporter, partial [Chloroflexi bacterium]|nr:HlyC/CorC family transporter [Chloroflexota bacterium]